MPGYADEAVGFERSRAVFDSVVAELADPEGTQVTHAELEERLTERSRELMRQLFQDHVDVRAAREERRADVVGVDQVRRSRVERGHRRVLATVFGAVTVERLAYRAAGAANLYPADAVLDLPEGRHSHGLRRLAAIEAVRGSFDDAAGAITRASGQRLGKRQVEGLARAAAADIEPFYAGRAAAPAPPEVVLVLSFDGKGVVMLPAALRQATAKAAAARGKKLTTRLPPGEKNGCKRMAEPGVVYDAVPQQRTTGDIIARPGQQVCATRRRGPAATGKWLTGSVVADISEVITAGFDEAERRDPRHLRTWVVLVDGNRTQIEAITAQAGRRQVTVHIVCDFIHVLEYLWKAAWSFFEPGDPDAEDWVAGQARKILDGKAARVAAGIRRRATTYGYSAAERTGADTCANYLTSKNDYLRYDIALASGWPVATGIIEGACRHLVKDRMDITGARWSLNGAEAILHLRALISNGDFDDYWRFHLQQEHRRVHQDRYQRRRKELILAA